MHRWRIIAAVLAALAPGLAPGKGAACDLALLLAVDVSGSVDSDEYRIQMDGLAEALRDPLISEALVRGQAALALLQWTGSSRQRLTLPWTRITDFDALDRFAARVEADPRIWRNYSTAIGEALAVSVAAFDDAPDCLRRVIDLSGDGESNEGVSPETIRPLIKARGLTVNAIAIEASEPALTDHFYEKVIWGNGAFVETAASFADYPARIRRKLLREVARQTASLPEPGTGNHFKANDQAGGN